MVSDDESDGSQADWGQSAEPPCNEAVWAAEARSLSEQLRGLASKASNLTNFTASARSAGLNTELSEPGLRASAEAPALLAALRSEAHVISVEASTAKAEAELAGAAGIRWVQASMEARESEGLAEHSALTTAGDSAREGLRAAAAAAHAAASASQSNAGARGLTLEELRAAVASATAAAVSVQRECESHAAAARRLPSLRANCAAVEERVAVVESECEALRKDVGQLRASKAVPSSASNKAEALELRLGSLERQSRLTAEPSPRLPAEALAEAQQRNRQLAGEVRDARAARERVAERYSHVKAEYVAASWQQEKLVESEACLRGREEEVQCEALLYREEIAESREEIAESERSEETLMQRSALLRDPGKEERRSVQHTEELAEAREQELEDKSKRLKMHAPDSVVSRCLYSAKSKAAKTRGPWARTAIR